MLHKSQKRDKPRLHAAVNYTLCLYCGACVGACPDNSIFLHGAHLSIDQHCSGCGRCANACPVHAIVLVTDQKVTTG